MLVLGLRLFVALMTFAVGVASAALLGPERPTRLGQRDITHTTIPVAAPSLAELPTARPHGPCSANRPVPYLISGGVLNGKVYSKPAPVYPQAAKAAGVAGTVVVQVEVEEDGCVGKVRAISGPSMLHDAAAEAARRARFSPTLLSGQPVRVSGVITYNFVLQ